MTKERTTLERDADYIDCDLYRLITRVERLYDTHKSRDSYARDNLAKSLKALRKARVGLRVLMHETDREETV
jgi:hypothetical protein